MGIRGRRGFQDRGEGLDWRGAESERRRSEGDSAEGRCDRGSRCRLCFRMKKSGTFWRQRRRRGLMRNDGWQHRHTEHRRQVWISKRGLQDGHSYSKFRGQQVRGKAICPERPEWHGGINANKRQKGQQGHRGAVRKPGLGAPLFSLHNKSRKHQNTPVSTVFPLKSPPSQPPCSWLSSSQWVDKEGRVRGVDHPTFMWGSRR